MEEYGFMKRLALLTLFCSLATGVIASGFGSCEGREHPEDV